MRSLRSRRRSKEKIFFRRSRSPHDNSLMPLTIQVARRRMRCLVGKAMTSADHTPGLASLEPDTRVGISLLSRLQNHDEAGTGFTGSDLLLGDSEEISTIIVLLGNFSGVLSANSGCYGYFLNKLAESDRAMLITLCTTNYILLHELFKTMLSYDKFSNFSASCYCDTYILQPQAQKWPT